MIRLGRTGAILVVCLGGCGTSGSGREPTPRTEPRSRRAEQAAAWVDPMIGTGIALRQAGKVFPGPTWPWGVVKLGPDTDTINPNAGYTPHGDIVGFSHVHAHGTGGGPKYGNILMVPTTGDLDITGYGSPRGDEVARVGYYAVSLLRYGVRAELTASRRVGFHRYTFPESPTTHILIDVGHLLLSRKNPVESQSYVGGEVTAVSASEARGVGRYRGGWNMGDEYEVHFCARLDTPAEAVATWKETAIQPGPSRQTDDGKKVGVLFRYRTFAGQVIQAKVGISFVSSDQACRNLEAEIPRWDFDEVERSSVREWNDILGTISIEGATDDERTVFYSALYRCHLMPTDRTGENPKWTSQEPHYDDYYAIWDTFRTLHPLLLLIQRRRHVDMIRSLVDIYRHEGYLPDGRSGECNGRTQGGSNADVVIAEAFLKGLREIDYQAAYAGMVKDAEVPPHDPQREGRGGIADYNSIGYVSAAVERSGNRTLEYSHDDWTIAQVAAGLGKKADHEKYLRRASNWANLWDPSVNDSGVTGFIRPRNPDGSWHAPFSVHDKGYWPHYFYESTAWEYSLYVPHDVRALIAKAGGQDAFIERLDTLFGEGYFNIGNEPGFLAPYLYLWAGRPDKTAERVRFLLRTYFRSGPAGLPGNDDSGAMSAWYVWGAIGLYPNAGSDVYLLGSPIFPKVVVRMHGGKALTIRAEGRGRDGENAYVQSVRLNGRPLERPWLRHAEIQDGAELVFQLGPRPSRWGTAAPPPSMSDP